MATNASQDPNQALSDPLAEQKVQALARETGTPVQGLRSIVNRLGSYGEAALHTLAHALHLSNQGGSGSQAAAAAAAPPPGVPAVSPELHAAMTHLVESARCIAAHMASEARAQADPSGGRGTVPPYMTPAAQAAAAQAPPAPGPNPAGVPQTSPGQAPAQPPQAAAAQPQNP